MHIFGLGPNRTDTPISHRGFDVLRRGVGSMYKPLDRFLNAQGAQGAGKSV